MTATQSPTVSETGEQDVLNSEGLITSNTHRGFSAVHEESVSKAYMDIEQSAQNYLLSEAHAENRTPWQCAVLDDSKLVVSRVSQNVTPLVHRSPSLIDLLVSRFLYRKDTQELPSHNSTTSNQCWYPNKGHFDILMDRDNVIRFIEGKY